MYKQQHKGTLFINPFAIHLSIALSVSLYSFYRMGETKENFNGYVLKDMIGKGAFGSVWKAIDTKNNNVEVAVKVIDRR